DFSVYILKLVNLSNGENVSTAQCLSEFRVKLQKPLKKRNPVKPRKPKNYFLSNLYNVSLCDNNCPTG
ncbi:MAG: hypothetical protein JZU49_04570, partial [Sulfuricurvum sp.]|nr:hypothetical protein [Sulfuricurvum sp.]